MRLLAVAIAMTTAVHASFAAPDVTSGPIVVSVDESKTGPVLIVNLGNVELATVSACSDGNLILSYPSSTTRTYTCTRTHARMHAYTFPFLISSHH